MRSGTHYLCLCTLRGSLQSFADDALELEFISVCTCIVLMRSYLLMSLSSSVFMTWKNLWLCILYTYCLHISSN